MVLWLLLAMAASLGAQERAVLAVTAEGEDYLLYAGGTLAAMAKEGAAVYVVCATACSGEDEAAAKALGFRRMDSLGYRRGNLAGISPTELRDRIVFHIRLRKPAAIFFPNPHAEYDEGFDRLHAGMAAEEAAFTAAQRNLQPSHAVVDLAPHVTPEWYFYAPPADPRRRQGEAGEPFVPQPKVVDIAAVLEVKVKAASLLRTAESRLAAELERRMNRSLPGQAAGRLYAERVRGLAKLSAAGTAYRAAEEFVYAGVAFQIPAAYRQP